MLVVLVQQARAVGGKRYDHRAECPSRWCSFDGAADVAGDCHQAAVSMRADAAKACRSSGFCAMVMGRLAMAAHAAWVTGTETALGDQLEHSAFLQVA